MRLSPIAAALLAAATSSVVASAQTSIAPAVEQASRSLAHVSVLFESANGRTVRVERSSSGFVIDPRGILLTNEHLVDEIPTGSGAPGGEYWLQVVIAGLEPRGAKVIARDERLDLALLQLELEAAELLPALELAAGAAPALGADAFALGRPRGEQHFALAGVVFLPSGPVSLRQATLQPGEALITDAAVLDDVNGGPFVDRRGQALGIVNTAQRAPFDPKADATKYVDPVDYALVISARAIRSAFPEHLGAPKDVGAAPGAADALSAIAREAAPSLVSIWAGTPTERPQHSALRDPYAEKPPQGLGSGVIVDPAGLVLTSSETAGDSKQVSVRLLDGRSFPAEVLRLLPASRVALLRLSLPEGVRLPAIELGSSEAAISGEDVVVLGNPYGHTLTLGAGVLAAVEKAKRLRIGAWVHEGHKGGALLDSAGRLIGIPVADIFEDEEEQRGESYLGVAQPIDLLRKSLAAELGQYGTAASLREAPAASEAELARRRNTVTGIVAATRDSLLNVEVHVEAKTSAAFDPFATAGSLRLLGQGSGVVIDASGLAITNWHVVEDALDEHGAQRADHAVEVTLPSGRRFGARVLATSRDDDLALIQLQLPAGEMVKPVPLGASKPLRRGDVLVAIGNPYGRANTVTVGIVAAKDQDAQIRGRLHAYKAMLQTDAAINPGNSGGALLDIEGRLVGINSAGRSGAGLAIPVERVREVFGRKLLATMGPFLGLTVDDGSDGGLVVTAIEQHGPAAKAGIMAGDRLRAVDGRKLASTVEYGNLLLASRPAAAMQIELERDGERVAVQLLPISQAVWRAFRQTGIEVAEIDYAAEAQLVREASLALHRAYTGLSDGAPSRLMSGALRVVQVDFADKGLLDVRPGDLLLGASASVRTADAEHARLVRFEHIEALRDVLEPIAAEGGGEVDCWLLRDGKLHTVRVPVTRVR